MKILIVSTISATINSFLIPHIKNLVDQGHQVDIACSINEPIDDDLEEIVNEIFHVPFERTVFKKNNISSYKSIKNILVRNNYDLVNTNTAIASAITRIASIGIKNLTVFYTCHGYSFCKGSSLKSWVVNYPIERLLAKFTDAIITINEEDYILAQSICPVVYKIPGIGIDFREFRIKISENKNEKKEELGLKANDKVILSVGELSHRKNNKIVIDALNILNNPDIKYIICGDGPLRDYLIEYAFEKNVENQLLLLGHRNDINEILNISDAFVFPSKSEGLGLVGLESMAMQVPLVASNRHGIKEYAIDGVTALTYDPNDSIGFAKGINKLLYDSKYANELVKNGNKILPKFSLENSVHSYDKVYLDYFNK